MNAPPIYNMTRYNTEDLTEIVRRTYMLMGGVMGVTESRVGQIQFREHKSDDDRSFYDSATNRNARMKPYVAVPSRNKQHQVKLLDPELLHGSAVGVLAQTSVESPSLPNEAVVMLMRHFIERVEYRQHVNKALLSVIEDAARQLPLRYKFNSKPKIPKEVKDFERELAEDVAWKGFRDQAYSVRRTIQQLTVKAEGLEKKYRTLKVDPVDAALMERLKQATSALYPITTEIVTSRGPIR